jgi:hypothetical protein
MTAPPVKLVRLQAVTGSLYVNPAHVAAIMPEGRSHGLSRVFAVGIEDPFIVEGYPRDLVDLMAGGGEHDRCLVCGAPTPEPAEPCIECLDRLHAAERDAAESERVDILRCRFCGGPTAAPGEPCPACMDKIHEIERNAAHPADCTCIECCFPTRVE